MADADGEPEISADKLKAAVTLGLSLEQAVKTGAVPLSADKLNALQTLGLTLKEAVEKGIVKATPAGAGAAKAAALAAAAKPAAAAEAAPAERKLEEEQAAQPSSEQAQEQERRKAAAARFAARATGTQGAKASQGQPKAAESGGDALAVPGGASDETLVEAISAVVVFKDASGVARVLAPQASEVAYLASDAVFWPLLRRMGAEILALEGGEKDLDGLWSSAPSSSEGALQFADLRGYLLPRDLAAPAADGAWRRAMLAEAASDLMTMRVSVQRGFDLPALAGPAEAGTGWVERPADSLEGVASAVDSSASAGLAEELVRDLGSAVGSGNGSAPADRPLQERLAAVAEAVAARAEPSRPAPPDSSTSPALKGGWNLLQEMNVREAAQGLRNEYTTRRQILLKRLDVTVQVMCNCERASVASVQRKTADILSKMWAGWRRDTAEAPPLSEWSALAVTRGVLARAVTARVSGPGARVSSKVKKVSIGAVPNRGGKPEGYTKKDPTTQAQPAAAEEAKASAVTVTLPKAQRGPRQRSFASGSGTTAGGGTTTASTGASSSSTGAAEASTAGAAGDGASSASGTAEPAFVAAKAEEKKAPLGARSTNKDAHKEYRQQKRKEWEGKVTNDYYSELAKHRK